MLRLRPCVITSTPGVGIPSADSTEARFRRHKKPFCGIPVAGPNFYTASIFDLDFSNSANCCLFSIGQSYWQVAKGHFRQLRDSSQPRSGRTAISPLSVEPYRFPISPSA